MSELKLPLGLAAAMGALAFVPELDMGPRALTLPDLSDPFGYLERVDVPGPRGGQASPEKRAKRKAQRRARQTTRRHK